MRTRGRVILCTVHVCPDVCLLVGLWTQNERFEESRPAYDYELYLQHMM